MKPPICNLCHKNFSSEYIYAQKGGLVEFYDYEPLPEECIGHSQGFLWFCEKHLAIAQSLKHLTSIEALAILEIEYGHFPMPEPESHTHDMELWIKSVGQNRSKIFSIIRQATGMNPEEAKNSLLSGEFKVINGWSHEFENWKAALQEAGATIEIRFV